jgi:uncharacterized protein (DUF2237 family)
MLNVLHKQLQPIIINNTDYYCCPDKNDIGTNIICVQITNELLDFCKQRGITLTIPQKRRNSIITLTPKLTEGMLFPFCVLRWREFQILGKAPKIDLERTHHKTLQFIKLNVLEEYKI